jgi:hypothetical protein
MILISDKYGWLKSSPCANNPVHKPVVEILFSGPILCSAPLVEARCAFVKIQLKQFGPIRDGWRRSSETNYQNICINHVTAVSLPGFLAGAGRVRRSRRISTTAITSRRADHGRSLHPIAWR